MLDPNRFDEAMSALRLMMEDISGDELERSLNSVRDMVSGIHAQLMEARELDQRLKQIKRRIEQNGSVLEQQKSNLQEQYDDLNERRADTDASLQQRAEAALQNWAMDRRRTTELKKYYDLQIRRQTAEDLYLSRMGDVRDQINEVNQGLALNAKHQKRINDSLDEEQKKRNRLTRERRGLLQDEKDLLKIKRQRDKNVKTIANALGMNPEDVNSIRKAFTGIGPAIAASLGIILREMGKVYKEFRSQGQSADQAVSNFGATASATFSGLTNGVIAAPSEFAANMAALQTQLGRMDVGRELTVEATRLTSQYKLSRDEATGLIGALERINGFQSDITADQIKSVEQQARFQGMAPGAVFRDIAKNTQYFAQYANKGFEAFAKSVMNVKKLGVELSTIEGFADGLVDDFETTLKNAAEISTYLPGFDSMRLVELAQNGGSPEDLAKALKEELNRVGMDSLSDIQQRSVRNKIPKLFNMDATSLENLMKGGQSEMKEGKPDVMKTETAGYLNSIGDVVAGAMTALTTTASLASLALMKLAASAWAAGRAGPQLGPALPPTSTKQFMTGKMLPVSAAKLGTKLARGSAVLAGGFAAVDQFSTDKAAGLSTGTASKNAAIKGVGGAGGAWGGAAAGAAIGTMLAPGIGTAAGAIIGGMLGAMAGSKFADVFTTKAEAEKKRDDVQKLEDKKNAELQSARIAAIMSKYEALQMVLGNTATTVLTFNKNLSETPANTSWMDRLLPSFKNVTLPSVNNRPVPEVSKAPLPSVNTVTDVYKTPLPSVNSVVGQKKHTGGMVGKGPMTNVPKFHTGLMPDEVPAILQRGEAVLSRSQLGGLTAVMTALTSLAKVGETFKSFKIDSIEKFSKGMGAFSQTITKSVTSLMSGKGIGGMISGVISKATGSGGLLGSITGAISGKSGNLFGAITDGIKKKAGGVLSGLFGGKAPSAGRVAGIVSGVQTGGIGGLLKGGGIKEKIGGFIGQKAGGFLSGLTGGNKNVSAAVGNVLSGKGAGGALSGLLGGKSVGGILSGKVGGFIKGKLGGVLGGVAGKIPGIGALGGLLGKPITGKALAGAAGKAVSGKLIGAAIGSVIPGAGTIVGGLLGGLAGKSLGKLGGVATKALGGIGKKIGGIFGKKKKKPAPAAAAPVVEQMSYPTMASGMGMAGLPTFGGSTQPSTGTTSPTNVTVDTKALEQKLDQLISLMQNGGIAVNMDGKKVSSALIDANNRG